MNKTLKGKLSFSEDDGLSFRVKIGPSNFHRVTAFPEGKVSEFIKSLEENYPEIVAKKPTAQGD